MKSFPAPAIQTVKRAFGGRVENLTLIGGPNNNPTRETECIASRTYDHGRIQLIKEQP